MFKVTVDKKNIQLDKFLKQHLDISVRRVKYLIKNGKVLVNNSPCNMRSYILKFGDVVEVIEDEINVDFKLTIIEGNGKIFGVYKPPFIHSEMGKSSNNMENILQQSLTHRIILLNRLDYLTSGILLFCYSEKVLNEYKIMQDNGLIEKRYIAKVHGKILNEIVVKNKIDDNKKIKVKVLPNEYDNKLRFTKIIPREYYKGSDITLVEARILKGKRHQIRAHLSFIGHPIVGDPIYGKKEPFETRMYLHNYMVVFPNFSLRVKEKF